MVPVTSVSGTWMQNKWQFGGDELMLLTTSFRWNRTQGVISDKSAVSTNVRCVKGQYLGVNLRSVWFDRRVIQ